ncbi:glycosyltransferase [Segetibacter sp. 3557_3]|uniref:glycosyltransferase family 4 protein n=1 Tax=Segetibacter sp. 3557_3 TaxID=2547429 RepID=UPI001058D007|nr:glycosyltransferase [Segetibacter sp. 3557_3]TDH28845.1 glycosyltransferase [Segetibacter sp. 3557_3]
MKFPLYLVKRRIEGVFIFPFILIGRLIATLKPLGRDYETFFFFPFYHTGGAEKVHALVTQALGNKNCLIYFTRKSQDKTFYNDFVQSGCVVRDISRFTDSKILYVLNLIYRGIITAYINRQQLKPVVFNGQCNLGYKISPWVNSTVPQVELIHSFNTFSWIRLPFIPFYAQTVMISKVRVQDHLQQYRSIGVPEHYANRIKHVVNGVPLPIGKVAKDYSGMLELLYVGRGTAEKRVHLVAAIAKGCLLQKRQVRISFMGDVENAIPDDLKSYCNFLGHKSNQDEIEQVYSRTHMLIVTSDTEGFPMVVEEAMARACVILATPVGDLPVHVKHGVNGFLFSSVADEDRILAEGVEFVASLCEQRSLVRQMGEANEAYAVANFGIDKFNQAYKMIFEQLRNSD